MPPLMGGDPKIEVLQIIRHFCTLASYNINAQQNLKVFNQKIRKHFESFQTAIESSKPKFSKLKQPKAEESPNNGPASFFWSSTPARPASEEPSKKVENLYTITDLKNVVNSQKGKELEGYSPYSAFEQIAKQSQMNWKQHTTTLLHNVSQELTQLMSQISEEVFGRFAMLNAHVRYISTNLDSQSKPSKTTCKE